MAADDLKAHGLYLTPTKVLQTKVTRQSRINFVPSGGRRAGLC